jgi:hypothetical protein
MTDPAPYATSATSADRLAESQTASSRATRIGVVSACVDCAGGGCQACSATGEAIGPRTRALLDLLESERDRFLTELHAQPDDQPRIVELIDEVIRQLSSAISVADLPAADIWEQLVERGCVAVTVGDVTELVLPTSGGSAARRQPRRSGFGKQGIAQPCSASIRVPSESCRQALRVSWSAMRLNWVPISSTAKILAALRRYWRVRTLALGALSRWFIARFAMSDSSGIGLFFPVVRS